MSIKNTKFDLANLKIYIFELKNQNFTNSINLKLLKMHNAKTEIYAKKSLLSFIKS
ncbi:hypothetical protein [Campylobacter fetus]|uniref:hypothetical protein n=1 Tax=Campylobacter fetus TaxID=196 RepID=UPI001301140D|nr:hypothetical protein [Campylobacter fetus]